MPEKSCSCRSANPEANPSSSMDAALAITIGGLVQGSVFALVAIGFALVYRVTGTVNLAQGAFVVLGALTTYSFEQTLGWPAALAAVAALAGAAIGGYVV